VSPRSRLTCSCDTPSAFAAPRRHAQHRMIQPTSALKAMAIASSVSTAMVIYGSLPDESNAQ
ncbi:MAG TPA: hypothetical protein VMR94_10240, partial [Hyphomicrobiaceae bacterium]|nr:hypothetical protein [Hyphomicrobiaceae bacterium]